ncbi:MAG: NRDE family protein [Halopenitus sp.]
MCTLVLAWQVFADAPVVAAANRDERFDRPAEPPSVKEGIPAVVAPRDARAGGTWVGCNDAGVYATITNRWLSEDREGDRSRGLLVDDCLAHDSAEAAVRDVERELDEREYDGFHLVVADESGAYLVANDGRVDVTRLDPGVHVVVNVGGVVNGRGRFTIPERRQDVGEQQAENARQLSDRLRPEPGESADGWLDRAGAALGDHDAGVCIHREGFGTRSSSIVRVGADGGTRFEFAEGPPCETAFEPVDLPRSFGGER